MAQAPRLNWIPGRALWAFRRDGLGFLERLAAEYGDAVRINAGGERFLFINHPDLIHDVLVVQHRDRRYYQRPLQFVPEQSAREARAARPRFACFPFGGGPRQCIGEGFAWLEGVIVLATLLQRHRVTLCAGARVEPWPLLTLRPRQGLPVRLRGRR